MFEETKQGLNLEIVDQDGRSMFADGSKQPLERTRRLLQKLAAPLKATPLRVAIVGHTSAGFVPSRSGYDGFDLSADRANVVRQILERRACRPHTSSRCPARQIPNLCFRTIPRSPQTGA
jgi:chemotaxis protein MotB